MNVVLFGATGMIGAGVLRECLVDAAVTGVVAVVRSPLDVAHDKLQVVRHDDFTDFGALADAFKAADACLFCLGVSSGGMNEQAYTRVTFDFTVAAARACAAAKPGMRFIYVSGAGTDASEKGGSMWARVKGKTENAVLALPLDGYMFRPGFIEPLDGIRSKTRSYRWMYTALRPFMPVFRHLSSRWVTDTRAVGRAMVAVARDGAPNRILENDAIDRLGTPDAP